MTKWLDRFHEFLTSEGSSKEDIAPSVSFVSADSKVFEINEKIENLSEIESLSDESSLEPPNGFINPPLRVLSQALAEKAKQAGVSWLADSAVPINRHRVLLKELRHLNRLWLKGELLEAQEHFEGKSERYRDRVVNLLGKVSNRVSEIWEILEAENPKLLRGEYFLTPSELIQKSLEAHHALSISE
jgi:hypothetical protein